MPLRANTARTPTSITTTTTTTTTITTTTTTTTYLVSHKARVRGALECQRELVHLQQHHLVVEPVKVLLVPLLWPVFVALTLAHTVDLLCVCVLVYRPVVSPPLSSLLLSSPLFSFQF